MYWSIYCTHQTEILLLFVKANNFQTIIKECFIMFYMYIFCGVYCCLRLFMDRAILSCQAFMDRTLLQTLDQMTWAGV
jgi:hypothetical protein